MRPRAAGSAEEIRAGLAERRDADLRLGRSSWGPHLDELKLAARGRSLRRYGSQGQQRAALLALLFAEREALLEARQVAPLLLLDDVMSELDPDRRERLVERLAGGGQALITAAAEDSLPARRARRAWCAMPLVGRRGGGGMTRRRAPRPAPRRAARRARPRRHRRRRWRRCRPPGPRSVGEQIAAVASPVSERGGEVLIGCTDSVWAQELDLMQEQLLERLRDRLGEQAPRSLRFRVTRCRESNFIYG